MKLKEYIKALKKLEKEHGDVELYYSIDDEGNSYDLVKFGPSVMYIAKDDIPKYGHIDPMSVNESKETKNDVPIIIIN